MRKLLSVTEESLANGLQVDLKKWLSGKELIMYIHCRRERERERAYARGCCGVQKERKTKTVT